MPLVVDEVEHRQHRLEPIRQLEPFGHAVGDLGVADLALRPHETLRHRGLGHEEGAGDLVGLQSTEQPQRERNLRARRERGVAAGEDQAETVVAHGAHLLDGLRFGVEQGGLGMTVVAGGLTAQAVDHSVAGGRGDPPAGIGRDAGLSPLLGGDHERLLDRVFGDVDGPEDADQDGDAMSRLGTEDPLEISEVDSGVLDGHQAVIRPGTAAPRRLPGTPHSPWPPTSARRRDRVRR